MASGKIFCVKKISGDIIWTKVFSGGWIRANGRQRKLKNFDRVATDFFIMWRNCVLKSWQYWNMYMVTLLGQSYHFTEWYKLFKEGWVQHCDNVMPKSSFYLWCQLLKEAWEDCNDALHAGQSVEVCEVISVEKVKAALKDERHL